MVGKLQDIVTAAVVIGAAEQKIGSPKSSKNSAQPEIVNKAPNTKVIIETRDLKVEKTNEIENLFEKDEERQPAVEEDDFHLEPGTLDEETVSLMTDQLNELMDKINCNLEFKYNKEVNLMTIKMIDKKTQEVIKEVPPEEMIENMVKAKDWLGAFIDQNI